MDYTVQLLADKEKSGTAVPQGEIRSMHTTEINLKKVSGI